MRYFFNAGLGWQECGHACYQMLWHLFDQCPGLHEGWRIAVQTA